MPRSTGWTWEKWETCALCGRKYRASQMTTVRSSRVCLFRPCADRAGGQGASDNDPRGVEFGENMEVADERR